MEEIEGISRSAYSKILVFIINQLGQVLNQYQVMTQGGSAQVESVEKKMAWILYACAVCNYMNLSSSFFLFSTSSGRLNLLSLSSSLLISFLGHPQQQVSTLVIRQNAFRYCHRYSIPTHLRYLRMPKCPRHQAHSKSGFFFFSPPTCNPKFRSSLKIYGLPRIGIHCLLAKIQQVLHQCRCIFFNQSTLWG